MSDLRERNCREIKTGAVEHALRCRVMTVSENGVTGLAQGEPTELIYREYARRSDVFDRMAASAFDDFKLLGALAVLPALWELFGSLLTTNVRAAEQAPHLGVPVAFYLSIAVLMMMVVIGLRSLLRQSQMFTMLGALVEMERELMKLLDGAAPNAESWFKWHVAQLELRRGLFVSQNLWFAYSLAVAFLVIPGGVLIHIGWTWALLYGATTVVAVALLHWRHQAMLAHFARKGR